MVGGLMEAGRAAADGAEEAPEPALPTERSGGDHPGVGDGDAEVPATQRSADQEAVAHA